MAKEEFSAKKIDFSQINDGYRYENGDAVSADAINAPIEAVAFVQSLAEKQPNIVDIDGNGATKVEIVQDTDGLPQFKFSNLKGNTGARIVNTELVGQDENGGNIYKQTFDNGVMAFFVAPRGEKGDTGTVENITPQSIGAVPIERTINNKQLNTDISLTASDVGALTANDLLTKIYPVGSIYMSTNLTSPASFLGGTWERIQDKFLLSAGSSYSAGTSGGSATHTLTVDEMPSHTHPEIIGSNPGEFFAQGTTADAYSLNISLSSGAYLYSNYFNELRATGGGQPHNNMPPYLAVYMWRRIS